MIPSVQQIEQLVQEGKFLEARSRAEHLLSSNNDIRLKQLVALSMAKSGSAKAAQQFLEPVHNQFPDDPETSGILGSIYKELFKETKNSKYATLSRDTYLSNFRLTQNYYTGINAASMSAISGSLSRARELAKEIITLLQNNTANVWETATLAEAHLLLQEKTKALELYSQCRQMIGTDWGKVNSIYSQLWLLNHYIAVSNQILNIFSPPAVATFVGHMIDQPSRSLPRFPETIENEIKTAIVGALHSINAKIGYCSMACGGDILFAESILETGGELNLFLPFREEDFVQTSVAYAGTRWIDRFHKLLNNHRVHYITTEEYAGNDDLFTLQARVIVGSAIHRSLMLHSSAHLITVFADMDSKLKEGGTKDTITLWPLTEKRININPHNLLGNAVQRNDAGTHMAPQRVPRKEERHVRFLISLHLNSSEKMLHERFHYLINKKLDELKIEEIESLNNGIVCAFKSVTECVSFAWSILKSPGNISPSIKIALHAGPVHIDTKKRKISGSNMEYLKSILQFAVAGKVYATFPFSSSLALETDRYAIEQAGIISTHDGAKVDIFQLNRHADAFDV